MITIEGRFENQENESQENESRQLDFLQALAHTHPSLKLSRTPKGDIDSVINILLSQLKFDHPKVGPVYWSCRCWALIYWQPVYLAVLAVHQHHSWISFKDFQLGFDGVNLSGFYFSSPSWLVEENCTKKISIVIKQQVLELKPLLERFFLQLTSVIKINTTNAWRLIADCILIIILEIQDINISKKIYFSDQWLKAFGLHDKKDRPYSQLKPVYNQITKDNQEVKQLVLDRKSCCMYFLIDPSNPCDTCKKYQQTL